MPEGMYIVLPSDHGLAVAVVCALAACRWHRCCDGGTTRWRSTKYAVACIYV